MEYHGNAFSFDTDRGEIYCNNRFVCDNSYHEAGCSDTVDQLLKVIEKSLGAAMIQQIEDNQEGLLSVV